MFQLNPAHFCACSWLKMPQLLYISDIETRALTLFALEQVHNDGNHEGSCGRSRRFHVISPAQPPLCRFSQFLTPLSAAAPGMSGPALRSGSLQESASAPRQAASCPVSGHFKSYFVPNAPPHVSCRFDAHTEPRFAEAHSRMGGRQRAKGKRLCSVMRFHKLHEVMRFCAVHVVCEICPQNWCLEFRILHCNHCNHCNHCCPSCATR